MQVGIIRLIQEDKHPAPPGHPENAERLKYALENVMQSDIANELINFTPRSVDISPVYNIHSEDYLNSVRDLAGRGGGYLDGDTYLTSGSYDAARQTASAAIAAAESIAGGEIRRILLAGRPPGHHAEREHGMGFCIINNAAVAAEVLTSRHKFKRVAIIDWDVHHGNGTQHAFYHRRDVFYISLHRYPFYPGSGASAERGMGEGEGYTLNIPLPGGTAAEKYLEVFRESAIRALEEYRPEFIIISCGFDAHVDDPLGGMGMTEDAYGEMTRLLVELSNRYSKGRILSLLEGGYNGVSNGLCLYQHLKKLQED